jgi:hypothetical protein
MVFATGMLTPPAAPPAAGAPPAAPPAAAGAEEDGHAVSDVAAFAVLVFVLAEPEEHAAAVNANAPAIATSAPVLDLVISCLLV